MVWVLDQREQLMTDTVDRHEHERQIAALRRRFTLTAVSALGVLVVLFFTALGVGWTLVDRAQDAAPEVIEEIATERRSAMETRLLARAQEAQALASDLFVFLQRVWQENAALHRVRANVQGATEQLRLLTGEVNAAMVSPTKNLGALLENGPTRANAVLDHAVAVASELRRLVPLVLDALERAQAAAEAKGDGASIGAVLSSMDALLDPFIGKNPTLHAQWKNLQADVTGWIDRVYVDLAQARIEFSGEQLSDEFMRRLRLRLF